MKKKSTSRHLWIGRIASAYAAGSASSSTITVETTTTTSEFVNADCSDSVPGVLFGLEAGEHRPGHREDPEQPDEPRERTDAHDHRTALADAQLRPTSL